MKIFNLKDSYFPITHGAIHAVIDASTVMVVFSTSVAHHLPPLHTAFMIYGYDLLAFAGQALFGYGMDRLRIYRSVTLLGIVLAACSVLLMLTDSLIAVVTAGLGNALFHVGAGAVVLNTNPGRAADAGIFVAPGALGLALGTWLGKGGNTVLWPFLLALSLSFAIAVKSSLPRMENHSTTNIVPVKVTMAILFLLLFSISIRAFVGFAVAHECPKLPLVSFSLACAAFGGKALGGIISDRLGWIRTSVGALLISAPLIALGGSNGSVVILGMFFFQMTMPVTLTAVYALMPAQPAFSFGLCSLALVLGACAAFNEPWAIYYNAYVFFGLITLSALAIFVALIGLRECIHIKGAAAAHHIRRVSV
jgi:FSR family fosmidomycin resistance protein-like MFS transporter